jgi:hypothetical protein
MTLAPPIASFITLIIDSIDPKVTSGNLNTSGEIYETLLFTLLPSGGIDHTSSFGGIGIDAYGSSGGPKY